MSIKVRKYNKSHTRYYSFSKSSRKITNKRRNLELNKYNFVKCKNGMLSGENSGRDLVQSNFLNIYGKEV